MVRGVNKTVIEISSTESGYFERAILFINPEQSHLSGKRLRSEAEKYVNSVISELPSNKINVARSKEKPSNNLRLKNIGMLSGWLCAVALLLLTFLNIL